jgi:hypothetical protein
VYAFFSKHEMVEFIADVSKPVQFLTKPNGKPSGQAIVQMRSRSQAVFTASVLNGQWMGSRYIEVFLEAEGSSAEIVDGTGAPEPDANIAGGSAKAEALAVMAAAQAMESAGLGDTGGSGSPPFMGLETPSPHLSPWHPGWAKGGAASLQFEALFEKSRQQAAEEAGGAPPLVPGASAGTGGDGSQQSWEALFDFLKRDGSGAAAPSDLVEGKPAHVHVSPI